MTIDDKIKDEKVQYDINRESAKISALSSGKIHKFEYLTSEEILPYDQSRVMEETKFRLGKAFEKQIRIIEDQEIKQVEALKALKSEENKQNIRSIEGIFS